MLSLDDLLRRGYFPAELHPPFRTASFADAVTSAAGSLPSEFNNRTKWTRSVTHSYARPGALRRRLSIPNPVQYYRLCSQISSVWDVEIRSQLDKSSISWSRPVPSTERAVFYANHWRELRRARAQVRATSRYVLITDISKYYGSLYTHVIPWAFHGRAVAKAAMKDDALLGNRLDKFVRECQEGQTIGIPIGPDASAIIAECVLSSIDQEIEAKISKNAFRHADDFEIGFDTYAEADNALAILQSILAEYELDLNASKTRIAELPGDIDRPWVRELSSFDLKEKERRPLSKNRLFGFFQLAFEQSKAYPKESVLGFALSRLETAVHNDYWTEFESLLYQCVRNDVSTLSRVLEILISQSLLGKKIRTSTLEKVLLQTIVENVPLGHGSEVGYAIWGCMLFDIKIDRRAVDAIKMMNDSIVALLALHAKHIGLIPPSESFPLWEAEMQVESLYGDQWLLTYEATMKKWLPSLDGTDFIASHPCFAFLRSSNVSFYDMNLLTTAKANAFVDRGARRHTIVSASGGS